MSEDKEDPDEIIEIKTDLVNAAGEKVVFKLPRKIAKAYAEKPINKDYYGEVEVLGNVIVRSLKDLSLSTAGPEGVERIKELIDGGEDVS
jgi:hypothetical protein